MIRIMHLVDGKPSTFGLAPDVEEALDIARTLNECLAQLQPRAWIENSFSATRMQDLTISREELRSTSDCSRAGEWRAKLVARDMSANELENLVIFLRAAARTAEEIAAQNAELQRREYERQCLRLQIEQLRAHPQEPTLRERRQERKALAETLRPSALDILGDLA